MHRALASYSKELVASLEVLELRLTKLEKAAADLSGPTVKKQKRWLTAKEVAAYLSVSLTTVHNWTKDGRLVKHKFGRTARFDLEEIDQRMNSFSPFKKPSHD